MNRDEEGWVFPLAAPYFPKPPFHMTPKTEYLMVLYEAEEEALRWEVPEPLELAPDPLCMVWIGEAFQPPHTHGRYHEGVVGIKVKYQDLTGWYSPYMWVHTDEALVSGHLYGFPKQLCDDTPLQETGNQINGLIQRRGQPLINLTFVFTGTPAAKQDRPERDNLLRHLGADPWLQLKKVASPAKGGKVLRQVVKIDMERNPPQELWAGSGTVTFSEHAFYPHLHKLAPKRYRYACYIRPDTILPYAEIVYEEFE